MSETKRRQVVLTAQQVRVMWLLVEGLSVKQMADRLDLSEHTVKFHMISAFAKFDMPRVRAAVEFVLSLSQEKIDELKTCDVAVSSKRVVVTTVSALVNQDLRVVDVS